MNARKQTSLFHRLAAAAALCALATGAALAAPIKIDAVVSPKEEIRVAFADGSKHFLSMIRREGKATGEGLLSGAVVTEYGRHDITPGVGGDAGGYLVFGLPGGDTAYVKWLIRAVFVPGPDGKPRLLDNGVWEVVSGTGKLKGLQGAGTLHIRFPSKTDRSFILEGELVSATADGKN